MNPELPKNPMTITPPTKMTRTAAGVHAMFSGRLVDAGYLDDVRHELSILRDWDNYERATNPEREEAKAALEALLAQKPQA